MEGGAGQRGFTPYLSESAKGNDKPDLKEFWHVGRELEPNDELFPLYPRNLWPKEISDFKEAMLNLYQSLEETSDILLKGLALYMDQDENAFTNLTDKGNTILAPLLSSIRWSRGHSRSNSCGCSWGHKLHNTPHNFLSKWSSTTHQRRCMVRCRG